MKKSISIESRPSPIIGEHRTSENFSTLELEDKGSFFWEVTIDGENQFSSTFDVRRQREDMPDETVLEGLFDGCITQYEAKDNLYIADARGLDENFIVTITSIV